MIGAMTHPLRELTVDRLRVQIFPDRAALGEAAGTAAAGEIARVLQEKGSARVILASAPSQNELLTTLTESAIDWSRVTLFHMDEYVGVDAQSPASFRRYQAEHVLSRIKPATFHGIAGEASDTESECARYKRLLNESPIDVVCLGIGENGHLAFVDPPFADFNDPLMVKIVELDEMCRHQQVHDGCFPNLDAVPSRAITLTLPALLRGKALFCAVPGPRKAQAVRDTLHGPMSPVCPATILRTHPNATLYLDKDSASLLRA
jgi:glucosamine-6-phosphate deaminase